MGTTGGDRAMLYETVKNSDVYAVISPQMGKQVHNKNLDLFSSIKIMIRNLNLFKSVSSISGCCISCNHGYHG